MDDWRELPSSRFFQWAERLPAYDGAVRAVLIVSRPPVAADYEQAPAQPPTAAAAEVSPETLAALSDHPDFPSIEFTGG